MAQFAGSAHSAEPSPLFAHRAHPTALKCKNKYPVLPLGKMSVRGYALRSVYPQFSFLPLVLYSSAFSADYEFRMQLAIYKPIFTARFRRAVPIRNVGNICAFRFPRLIEIPLDAFVLRMRMKWN